MSANVNLNGASWKNDFLLPKYDDQACWTISNITAGNRQQIQAVIDANIFPVLIDIQVDFDQNTPFSFQLVFSQSKAEFKTRKEAAWAITNASSGGTAEQIKFLVQQGCIPPLCDLLTVMDSKIVQVNFNPLACGSVQGPQKKCWS